MKLSIIVHFKEIQKVEHGLTPDIMHDIFEKKKDMSSETCNRLHFSTRTIKFTCYLSETISFKGPKM